MTNPISRSFLTRTLLLALLLAGPVSAHAQESRENADYKMAMGLYNDRMYDLAAEQLKNFIAAYPATQQGIEARYTLGLTQLKLKQFETARTTFQNFAVSYPDHPKAPDAWMAVGDAYASTGNSRDAAEAYDRVRLFHPKSPLAPEGLFKAADIFLRTGDRQSARRDLLAILSEYSSAGTVLPARLSLARLYALDGNYDLAEREALKLTESGAPDNLKAGAFLLYGKILLQQSLFDDATSAFSKVTASYKSTPAAAEAQLELGLLKSGGDRPTAGIEELKSVAALPNAPDSIREAAAYAAALGLERDRKPAEARKAYEALARTFPDGSTAGRALLGAARCALQSGDAAGAVTLAGEVISRQEEPLQAEALSLSSQAHEKKGSFAEAARLLGALIDRTGSNSQQPALMMRLARLYAFRMQQPRSAISLYDEIVSKHPASPFVAEAIERTGECQLAAGDAGGAAVTWRSLGTRFPGWMSREGLETRIMEARSAQHAGALDALRDMAGVLAEMTLSQPSGTSALALGNMYLDEFHDPAAADRQFIVALSKQLDTADRCEAEYGRARAAGMSAQEPDGSPAAAIKGYESFLEKHLPHADASPLHRSWIDNASANLFRLRAAPLHGQALAALASDFLSRNPNSSRRTEALQFASDRLLADGEPAAALNLLKPVLNQPSDNRLLFTAAQAEMELHRSDSALPLLRRIIAQSPVDSFTVEALALAGREDMAGGRTAQAAGSEERLANEFPYTRAAGEAASILASLAEDRGDIRQAISRLNPVIERLPDDAEGDSARISLTFRLAFLQLKNRDTASAVARFHECLRKRRSGQDAQHAFAALAELARRSGNAAHAASYTRLAGGAGPSNLEVADMLYAQEQYAEASKMYAALVKRETDNPAGLFRKAILSSYRADDKAGADKLLAEYRAKFAKADSDEAAFLYEEGSYYYRKHDLVTAEKLFDKVAGDYKSTRLGPWGKYYIGKIREVGSKLKEAAGIYDEILSRSPQSDVIPRVLLSLGNMHFNEERFEDAIRFYRKILDLPDSASDAIPYALNNLIEAYESTKLYDAAIGAVQDYLRRFPSAPQRFEKRIKLGTLYTKGGYFDQAVGVFQGLIDEGASGAEAELRYDIGDALYHKGDYSGAVLEFLKVPYLVSTSGTTDWVATSLYMAGQSYEKQSKFGEAVNMYQQIIDRPGISGQYKAGARKEIERLRKLTGQGKE